MVATADNPNRFGLLFSGRQTVSSNTQPELLRSVVLQSPFYHLDVEEVQSVEVNLRRPGDTNFGAITAPLPVQASLSRSTLLASGNFDWL